MAKAITKIESGLRIDPLSILAEETREKMKADFHRAMEEHGPFAWAGDGGYIRTCLRGIHQGINSGRFRGEGIGRTSET